MRLPVRTVWENAYSVITPQIMADGNHVWPFDSSFPIDVRFFAFGGQNRIRMNRHDYYELLYLLSGELAWQIQDRRVVQRAGELIVIGSALYHHPWGSEIRKVEAMVLYFLPELIEHGDFTGDAAEYLTPFRIQDARFPHVIPARRDAPARVFELMKFIYSEIPAATPRARLCVKTCLKMILTLLVNHYSDYRGTHEILARRQAAIQRLQPLFGMIERSYSGAISVEDAAQILGMSNSHFRRFFKQVTGQPFISYLSHFRIAKAQHLLASSATPIHQIAQDVGFCDQSYFGLTFRTLVHMTPLQYRQAVRNASYASAPSRNRMPSAAILSLKAGLDRSETPEG